MGSLVAAMASSHAFTVMEPEVWDEFREWNRGYYRQRQGTEAPVHPKLETESLEANRARYENVRRGLDALREELRAARPDALIIIGDDQDENYSEECLPQLAVYCGERFVTKGGSYRCHAELAETILGESVRRGFDLAVSRKYPEDRLKSHAHAQLLERLTPEGDIPVVLLFVDSIHAPAVEPSRCYAFGEAVRAIIDESRPAGERVAVCASGGLSHFSAGFPYHTYSGPHHYGSISEEFDRNLLDAMARGVGRSLAMSLSSGDLLEHGDIEFRSWLTLLGMVGDAKATVLAYEPFYRAIMGMGVARWDVRR